MYLVEGHASINWPDGGAYPLHLRFELGVAWGCQTIYFANLPKSLFGPLFHIIRDLLIKITPKI